MEVQISSAGERERELHGLNGRDFFNLPTEGNLIDVLSADLICYCSILIQKPTFM